MNAASVYQSSRGELTRAYYSRLQARGALGLVALNLFRAQKSSARAKVYHGGIRGVGSFRSMAYERKNWSIEQLCNALAAHPELGISFGWKKDPARKLGPNWLLYVDLPEGQVSFHSTKRYNGADYSGEWDGEHKSKERIISFCDRVFYLAESSQLRFDPANLCASASDLPTGS